MSEKPLHVLVAEALGWQDIERCGDIAAPWASGYDGRPPGAVPIIGHQGEERAKVPRYDLEWSATGPLIEQLAIHLQPEVETEPGRTWGAYYAPDGGGEYVADQGGPTPLIAICNLILAVHADGRLTPPPV